MTQLEFEPIRRWFSALIPMRRKPVKSHSAMEYTIRLSAALRVYNLTHAIHDVLCAVAKLQAETGHATIPAVCNRLACTYQCVMQHLLKNPDLFIIDDSHTPRRFTLSAESIRLLTKIKKRTH